MNNNLITKFRKKQKLSKKAFAKRVGISRTTVHNIEMGFNAPNFKTLQKIAQSFLISVDELLQTDQN